LITSPAPLPTEPRRWRSNSCFSTKRLLATPFFAESNYTHHKFFKNPMFFAAKCADVRI